MAPFLARSRNFMDALGLEYEHILIDDGSTDRTLEIARGFQREYPQLRVISNGRNEGVGWATRKAISLATKEVLFWQTVDWAYDISRLGEHLPLLETHDIVQGYRPRALSSRSDSLGKGLVSWGNYLLVRTLFGLPLKDYQNVTLYRTKFAQSIVCESHSSFTNPELLLKSYWRGATFKEVCIPFLPRDRGKAKGTKLTSVFSSLSQILYFWVKWNWLRQRPGPASAYLEG